MNPLCDRGQVNVIVPKEDAITQHMFTKRIIQKKEADHELNHYMIIVAEVMIINRQRDQKKEVTQDTNHHMFTVAEVNQEIEVAEDTNRKIINRQRDQKEEVTQDTNRKIVNQMLIIKIPMINR